MLFKKSEKFYELNSSQQIKYGAIISYIGIIVKIVAGLLYTPWMIDQIGQNNYGLYTLATSLISIFLMDFGLSTAVARFISIYNAKGDQKSINNLLGVIYKLLVLIDILIFIILIITFLFIDLIYAELTVTQLNSFRVIYIIIAIFSVISFPFTTLNGILSSYERFVELKICDLFQKIATDLLIIIALLFGYGLYALVTVNAIVGLSIILIKYIIVRRKTPVRANVYYRSKSMIKEIFSFSIWSTIISISQRLIFNLTPSILGAVSGATSIAIFGISSVLEGYVFNIANALNGLFLPKITRIATKVDSNEDLLSLMIKVGRIQLSIVGLIIVGFFSVGKDFVTLWMGKDSTLIYYCTILLMIPSIIYLPQQIAETAIVVFNKVRLQSMVFIVMSVLNIVLSIPLSIRYGALGASLAICISYLVRSIGLNLIYKFEIKLDIWKYFMECHIKLFKPIFISLLFGLAVDKIITDVSLKLLITKGTIIVLVYFILMWMIGFNRYEKELLLSLINAFRINKN